MSTQYIMICEARREYLDPERLPHDTEADVVSYIVWKRWHGHPMEVLSEHNDRFEDIWHGRAIEPWTDAVAEVARRAIETPTLAALFREEKPEIVLMRCAAHVVAQRERALEELSEAAASGDVEVRDDGCTIQWPRRDGELLVAKGATPYEAYREYRRLAEHSVLEEIRRSSLQFKPLTCQTPAPVRGSFVTDVERVMGFSGMQIGGEIVTRLTIQVPAAGLVAFASLQGRWVQVLYWVPRTLCGWSMVREHGRNESAHMLVEAARWDDPERLVTLLGRRDAGNGIDQTVRHFSLVRIDPVDAPDPLPEWATSTKERRQ